MWHAVETEGQAPRKGTEIMKQSILWIDHHEARIVELQPEGFREETLRAPPGHASRHPKQGLEAHEHPVDARDFFHEVAKNISHFDEVLIVGPSNAKKEFVKHMEEHERSLRTKIVGVETMDHPTDGQLAAHARLRFDSSLPRKDNHHPT